MPLALAANEPDTSERFREAMSICTMPGPELAPRLERLSETGWVEIEPDEADVLAFRDAAFIGQPPADAAAGAWKAGHAATPADVPDRVFRNGAARLGIIMDAPGRLGCVLAMPNSIDSDLVLKDLADAGAVAETGPVRTAAMATLVLDSTAEGWRTEIDLASADAKAAETLLGTPLAATFSAIFQSRARE